MQIIQITQTAQMTQIAQITDEMHSTSSSRALSSGPMIEPGRFKTWASDFFRRAGSGWLPNCQGGKGMPRALASRGYAGRARWANDDLQ